jgi:serine/threonine-protein kinase
MVLHYRIAGKIGAGGMGVVWRAVDTKLDRDVALKFLPHDAMADAIRRERFIREARAASALNHPNIVTIYEINSFEGADFIAMELVRGQSLLDLVRGHRRVAPAQAVAYGIQIAEGLAKAHRAGIVHRDIKPANIMVSDEGLVKILDFGLAKLSDAAPQTGSGDETQTMVPQLTKAGVASGTVGYMAPEQLSGDAVDARADIFSAGVVLYELVCGARPFRGASHAEIFRAVLAAEPPPIGSLAPNVPAPLVQVVSRCLEKSPEARYANASELKEALRAVEIELTRTEERPVVTTPIAPVTSAPKRWRIVTGIAAVLALAAGGGLYYARHKPAGPGPSGAAQKLPATPAELYLLAREDLKLYYRKGNIEQAIDALQAALNKNPNNAAAMAALGMAYVRKNVVSADPQWPRLALEASRRAVELNGDLAEAHVALGWALAASGKPDDAATELERAQTLDPLSGSAYLGLANVRASQRRATEAEPLFRRATELSPTDWLAWSESARFYYGNARYQEAVNGWRQAAQLAPDNARLFRNLGAGYHMLDQYAEAAASFQRALELEPGAATWSNLGTARFFEGRYSDAARAMEKAVELGPTNYLYWGNLGDAYRWAPGLQPKAAEAYIRAIQLVRDKLAADPKDIEAGGSLAVYLAKSGAKTEAVQEAARIEKSDISTPGSKFKMALAYEIAGRRDDALRALNAAMQARYSAHEIANEPELAQLRTDVRYHRMAAQYAASVK